MFKNLGSLDKGLLRKPKVNVSKQNIVENRMFGSRRGKTGKDLQIGRKFSKGKSTKLSGDMKSSAISPSIEDFDKMMSSLTGGSKKKKKMFDRDQ